MAAAEQIWKQKYYDSLEDFEQKEKQWSSVEDLLRRTISRLTLAADGLDTTLDRQLKELRDAIRDRADNRVLSRKIESMSETLVKLDRQRSKQKNAPPPTHLLEQLLDQLKLPKGTGRQLKAVRKQLGKASKDTPAEPLVKAVAELLSEALSLFEDEQPAPTPAENKGGLLKRLLGKGEAPPAEAGPHIDPLAEARELLAHMADQVGDDPGTRIRKQALDTQQARDLQRLGKELLQHVQAGTPAPDTPREESAVTDTGETPSMPLEEALLRLLEQLQLPPEFDDDVQRLQGQLEKADSNTPWQGILEDIAGLVSTLRSRIQAEKKELEDFLKQLTERLQEVDEHLTGSEAFREERLKNSRELDAAVKQGVHNIESTVRDADDLEELKTEVKSHVENIVAQLEKHEQEEERSHQEARVQVIQLQDRLLELESETEELRDRVSRERQQAMTDALTGIPNRMALDERLEQEVARWKRFNTPLAMLMWDVDRFKNINDSYGHKAGDKVLKTVARTLQENIRETDFLARFGGEEFALVMTGTELPVIQEVADKLRNTIAECGFHFRDTAVQVTISCGIAQFAPGDTPETVFERADQALYRAKENGRNRCEVADQP